jgi:hypothetical protein
VLVLGIFGCGHAPQDAGNDPPKTHAASVEGGALADHETSPGDAQTGASSDASVLDGSSLAKPGACPEVSRDETWLAVDEGAPELPVIDDPSHNLAKFYARWAEIARGTSKRTLRIALYGDSNMTMDGLTAMLRRAFQKKYGDAGHGFVALARPWGWYHHHDVVHGFYENMWTAYATTTAPAPDNHMGFSGIAAESKAPGALTWVATAEGDSPIGKTASRFGVYYLKRPMHATFEVRLDGKGVKEVDTFSPKIDVGYDEITTEDAAHKVAFAARGGTVRLLGATLERDLEKPSVTVDSLGVGSLNAWALARLDTAPNREMLKHRDYDLVMFLIGTNMYALEKHDEWMGRVIRHHRAATPGVPMLFLAPPDITLGNHGKKTDPRIHKVAEQLHDIAKANDAAFWDFHAAMGGDLSIVAFRNKKWAQADLIHFTDDGSFFMGRRVLLALWNGFKAELDKSPLIGCPVSATH